jgi:polysaccharide pyruvyl transferase WcaK-like protein
VSTARRAGAQVRVGVYGFFGMGNLGNEGSLSAVLGHLRERNPDVEVVCFGVDPEQVLRDHGVGGRRLMGYRAAPGDSRPVTQVRKLLGRMVDLPRTVWLVRSVDVLVVPGTGVFESRLMSTPWGLPYWMATAFLAARILGRPTGLVGVGAEPPTRRSTGLLMATTIRSATHVTYRDDASRAAAAAMGATGRPGTVAPDVAFLLPGATGGGSARDGHVVVGVMAFEGGADDPARGPAVVDTYVERMTRVLSGLLEAGRTVELVVGDLADEELARRLERSVRATRPATAAAAVCVSHAADLMSLVDRMALAEVVVASRFHNVIAGLLAGRPVVSLGYAGKNRDLLRRYGLAERDQPIDSFDVDRLLADIEEVAGSQGGAVDVAATTARLRAEAVENLDELWAVLLSRPPRGRSRAHG